MTEDVYAQQRQELTAYLRILQNNSEEGSVVTLDKYINLIYKDVYARYLISKGIGVEWQCHGQQFGVAS